MMDVYGEIASAVSIALATALFTVGLLIVIGTVVITGRTLGSPIGKALQRWEAGNNTDAKPGSHAKTHEVKDKQMTARAICTAVSSTCFAFALLAETMVGSFALQRNETIDGSVIFIYLAISVFRGGPRNDCHNY